MSRLNVFDSIFQPLALVLVFSIFLLWRCLYANQTTNPLNNLCSQRFGKFYWCFLLLGISFSSLGVVYIFFPKMLWKIQMIEVHELFITWSHWWQIQNWNMSLTLTVTLLHDFISNNWVCALSKLCFGKLHWIIWNLTIIVSNHCLSG